MDGSSTPQLETALTPDTQSPSESPPPTVVVLPQPVMLNSGRPSAVKDNAQGHGEAQKPQDPEPLSPLSPLSRSADEAARPLGLVVSARDPAARTLQMTWGCVCFRPEEVAQYEALYLIQTPVVHEADIMKPSVASGARRGSGGALFGADDTSALLDADTEAYLFFLRSGLPSALLKDIIEVAVAVSRDAMAMAVPGDAGAADAPGSRKLTRDGWYLACKGIALAQVPGAGRLQSKDSKPTDGTAWGGGGSQVPRGWHLVAPLVQGSQREAEELTLRDPQGVGSLSPASSPAANPNPNSKQSPGSPQSKTDGGMVAGGTPLLPDFNIAIGDSPPATTPEAPASVRLLWRRPMGGSMSRSGVLGVSGVLGLEAEHDRWGSGSMSTTPGSRIGAVADLEVHIASPTVQEQGAFGALNHTVYTVFTRTQLGFFPRSEVTVIRRFSDFEWLHERLRLVYHGIILPPLPPKRLVKNVDKDFIRERMDGLGRYMARLVRHPRLVHSFELQTFLSASREGIDAAKGLMPAAGQVGKLDLGPVGVAGVAAGAAGAFAAKARHLATNQTVESVGSAVVGIWGSLRKSIGFPGAPGPPPPPLPDENFVRLAEVREEYHVHFAKALGKADNHYKVKRSLAHEAWRAGDRLRAAFATAGGEEGPLSGLGGTDPGALASQDVPSEAWTGDGGSAGLHSLDPSAAERALPAVQIDREHRIGGVHPPQDGDLALDTLAELTHVFGVGLERVSKAQFTNLDRELDFVEAMRFQCGLHQSEKAMINDREAAVRELHEASAMQERHRQDLQSIRVSTVEGSNKMAIAMDQMRTTEVRVIDARTRLEAISASYSEEVGWCDAERVRDLKASLLDFVHLQIQQAQTAGSLRQVLDGLAPTDDELKASQERIRPNPGDRNFGAWAPSSYTSHAASGPMDAGKSTDMATANRSNRLGDSAAGLPSLSHGLSLMESGFDSRDEGDFQ